MRSKIGRRKNQNSNRESSNDRYRLGNDAGTNPTTSKPVHLKQVNEPNEQKGGALCLSVLCAVCECV